MLSRLLGVLRKSTVRVTLSLALALTLYAGMAAAHRGSPSPSPSPGPAPSPSSVPEIDPGSASAALGLLVGGVLLFADRVRRK